MPTLSQIAFFTTRPSFSTHPSAISFLQLLARDVKTIDIYSENDVLRNMTVPDNLRCISLSGQSSKTGSGKPPEGKNFRSLRSLKDYLKAYRATAFIYDTCRDVLRRVFIDRTAIRRSKSDRRRLFWSSEFLSKVDRYCQSCSYDIAIGLGQQGLILARLSLPNTRLVYFSDELYYKGHPDLECKRFALEKDLEKQCFQDVSLVLIQDENRARLLFKDNDAVYDDRKVCFFPVSWIGSASIKRTDFFIRRFPELKGKKILLQHGSLVPQRMTGQLMRVSKECPDRYAMVFHGGLSPYLKNDYRKAKCWLSKPDLPLNHLEEMVAGAYIGLVFYTTDNENDRLIAHSSGQLAMYLKCGVPIICNAGGTLARLVTNRKCGLAVDNAKEIFKAADVISKNYKSYCENSVLCFEAEYRLNNHYKKLLEGFKSIL